jgi:hypothetical protein
MMVVEMHTWSPDWKLVINIIIIINACLQNKSKSLNWTRSLMLDQEWLLVVVAGLQTLP